MLLLVCAAAAWSYRAETSGLQLSSLVLFGDDGKYTWESQLDSIVPFPVPREWFLHGVTL